MKRFLIALQLMTTIPVRVKDIEDKDIAGSINFFPIAGAIIGTMLAGLNVLLSALLPSLAANALLLVFWVLITGGLHLDGLADTIDGFSAGSQKEKIVRVMHDSATGAKGVVALVLILLLKFSLMCYLEGNIKELLLFVAPVFSRYCLM